ncbi:MAG: hypothetical protein QXR71_03255 [Candidatus Aenigmatarchaeota archaeon]
MPVIKTITLLIIGVIALVILSLLIFIAMKARIPMIPYAIDRDTAYALASTAALSCAVDFVATDGKESVSTCYKKISYGEEYEESYVILPTTTIVSCGREGRVGNLIYYKCTSIYKDSVNVVCDKSKNECKVIGFTLPQKPSISTGFWLFDEILLALASETTMKIPVVNLISTFLLETYIKSTEWCIPEIGAGIASWYSCFIRAFQHPKYIVMFEKLDEKTEDWWVPRDEPIEWAVASIAMGGITNILPMSKTGLKEGIKALGSAAKKVALNPKAAFNPKVWRQALKVEESPLLKSLLTKYLTKHAVKLILVNAGMTLGRSGEILREYMINKMYKEFLERGITSLSKLVEKGESFSRVKKIYGALYDEILAVKGDPTKITVERIKSILTDSMLLDELIMYDRTAVIHANSVAQALGYKNLDDWAIHIQLELVDDFNKYGEKSLAKKIFKRNLLDKTEKEALGKELKNFVGTDEFEKFLKVFIDEKTIKNLLGSKGTLRSLEKTLEKLPKKEAEKIRSLMKDYIDLSIKKALYEIRFLTDEAGEEVAKYYLEKMGSGIWSKFKNVINEVNENIFEKQYFGTLKYYLADISVSALGMFEDVPLGFPSGIISCGYKWGKWKQGICYADYIIAAIFVNAMYSFLTSIYEEPYNGCGGNSMCLYATKYVVAKDMFNISLEKPHDSFITVKLENLDWFGFSDRSNRAWIVSPCKTDLNVTKVKDSGNVTLKCDKFYPSNKLYFKVKEKKGFSYPGMGEIKGVTVDICENYIDPNSCTDTSLIGCIYREAPTKCNINRENFVDKIKDGTYQVQPINYRVLSNGMESVISECTSSAFTGIAGFFGAADTPREQIIIDVDQESMKKYYNEMKIIGLPDELQVARNYCVPYGGKIESVAKNICEIGGFVGSILLTLFTAGTGSVAALFVMGAAQEGCGWWFGGANLWPNNQF